MNSSAKDKMCIRDSHKGRNKHHLEYWIDYSINKTGLYGMKMPLRYVC